MMRRFLICLLIAGCETEAAAPVPGFQQLVELERPVAQSVEQTLALLPTETRSQPLVDYMPRTLTEARRLIAELEDHQVPPFREACETPDWLVLSHDAPDSEQRFRRGWAIERTTLKVYAFEHFR